MQQLPRQETMFVHGVSPNFLQVGEAKAAAAAEGQQVWNKVCRGWQRAKEGGQRAEVEHDRCAWTVSSCAGGTVVVCRLTHTSVHWSG